MEANSPAWEQQALINELKQGRELAKQLQNHLNPSTASSETRLFLVQKIISSYEKTLTKLNPSNNSSKNNSPRSQGSSHQHYSTHQDASKKRKAMPKWTEQVQVKSETGLESPLDDGHSWRKYGQKDILGATHPRGYYRCTHRHVQGCLATKQVQRSDQDPTIFHITYRGQHTCTKSANSSPNPNKPSEQQKRRKTDHTSDQLRFSFGVKNEERSPLEEQVFPTFSSFPSTSSGNKPDDYVFMSTSAAEAETEDQFMCAAEASSFSPLYISSATSDSDFYPPCHVPGGLGLSQLNVQISEFEAAGSCLNFGSNSPMGVLDLDLDFPVGSATSTTAMDFDSSFPFGFLDYD